MNDNEPRFSEEPQTGRSEAQPETREDQLDDYPDEPDTGQVLGGMYLFIIAIAVVALAVVLFVIFV